MSFSAQLCPIGQPLSTTLAALMLLPGAIIGAGLLPFSGLILDKLECLQTDSPWSYFNSSGPFLTLFWTETDKWLDSYLT